MAKTTKKTTKTKTTKAVAKVAGKPTPKSAKDKAAPVSETAAAGKGGKGKRNAGLASGELRRFRELLLAKRATLLGDVTSMANEALGRNRQDASGDLSNMPIHMADIGSDNYEQEFTLGLLESEQQLLREINAALIRMDKGTYGVCLGTGRPIGKPRLEAKPWAKYSIEYARQVEKGLVPEIELSENDIGGQS